MVANAGTDGGETAEPNGLRGSQEQAGGWLLQQPLFVYLLRAAWPCVCASAGCVCLYSASLAAAAPHQ